MKDGYRVPVAEGDRIRAGLAAQLMAIATGASEAEIASGERLAPAASRARYLAMYLSHVGFGWPLERVGHAFGLNRATAAAGCRWAEDARERPEIDALLDRLEVLVQDICSAPGLDLGREAWS